MTPDDAKRLRKWLERPELSIFTAQWFVDLARDTLKEIEP